MLTQKRIRINSELVIDSLNELTGCNLPTPCTFLHPFKVLMVYEEAIRKYYDELSNVGVLGADVDFPQSPGLKKRKNKNWELIHFERLIDFMNTYLKPELSIAKDIRERNTEFIYFSHLWHLFPPGELVYVESRDRSQPVQL